jgi:hypothetical protein
MNGNQIGVEFPLFLLDSYNKESFELPPCCIVDGKKIIIRASMNNEVLAGKLYAYMIRILYGEEGIAVARKNWAAANQPLTKNDSEIAPVETPNLQTK